MFARVLYGASLIYYLKKNPDVFDSRTRLFVMLCYTYVSKFYFFIKENSKFAVLSIKNLRKIYFGDNVNSFPRAIT